MTLNYNIAAHPTTFKGRQYRSKLEAKWAAFFTDLDWEYEYEPFDLSGWSPDFLLIGNGQELLVEVKPITVVNYDIVHKIEDALHPRQCALLVGCTLPVINNWVCAGWVIRKYTEVLPNNGAYLNPSIIPATFVSHRFKGFGYRISHDGILNLRLNIPQHLRVEECWRRAGNAVQWHPR